MPGNQYNSRNSYLWALIYTARDYLELGDVEQAQEWLALYRKLYAQVPASTRRRWKCGR